LRYPKVTQMRGGNVHKLKQIGLSSYFFSSDDGQIRWHSRYCKYIFEASFYLLGCHFTVFSQTYQSLHVGTACDDGCVWNGIFPKRSCIFVVQAGLPHAVYVQGQFKANSNNTWYSMRGIIKVSQELFCFL